MIGYIFHSIGFGVGDLLLFVFSILAGTWIVSTWRRGTRSLPLRLVTVMVMLFAFMPFLMLGLAFLAAKGNAPSAITTQPALGLQNMAMNMGSSVNTQFREAEPSFTADNGIIFPIICLSIGFGFKQAQQLDGAGLEAQPAKA